MVSGKGGLAGQPILFLVDFSVLLLLSNYFMRNYKFFKFYKTLIFAPVLVVFSIGIISFFNPSFQQLKKSDWKELKIDKYLETEKDLEKSLMLSNDLQSVMQLYSKDPHLALAVFFDLKNRFRDKFGENNNGYNLIRNIERKLSLNPSKYLPSCVILNRNEYLQHIHLIFQIIFALFVYKNFKSKHEIRYALEILFIFSSMLAVVGILQKINYIPSKEGNEILGIWDAPEPRYFYASFTYKNHWSAYAILALSIGASIIVNYIRRNLSMFTFNPKLWFLVLCLVPLIISIPHSGSRSGFLILVFLIIFLIFITASLFRFYLNKTRIYITAVSIVAVFVVSFTLHKKTTEEMILNSFSQVNSSKPSLRFLLWKDLLYQVSQNTFWGFGCNSYTAINSKFQSFEVREMRLLGLRSAHRYHRPLVRFGHSDALQYFSEMGWIIVIMVGVPILLLVLKGLFFSSSTTSRILNAGNLCFLLYCVIDFPTRSPACLMVFVTLVALSSKYCVLSKSVG